MSEQEFVYITPETHPMGKETFKESGLNWVSCPVCGMKSPEKIVPQIKPRGALTRGEGTDTTPLYSSPDHSAIILGRYGVAKSTLLIYLVMALFSNAIRHGDWVCPSQYGKGYLTFYRSLGTKLESLIFCDLAPVQFFLPKECKIKYNHPNLHPIYHDLDDHKFIIEHARRDMINVIAIDHFLEGDDDFEWWWKWTKALLDWKRLPAHIRLPVLVALDEMRFWIPNRGETISQAHAWYGNLVREQIDAFRYNRIKILGTVHSLTEMKPVFRNNISYWLIKTTTKESVPKRFEKRYGNVIEDLKKEDVFIKGLDHKFKIKPSIRLIKTYPIGAEIVKAPYLDEDATKGEQKVRWQMALANHIFKECGLAHRKRAKWLGYSIGGLQELEARYPIAKCPLPIDPEAFEKIPDDMKKALAKKEKPSVAASEVLQSPEVLEEPPIDKPLEGIDNQLDLMSDKSEE